VSPRAAWFAAVCVLACSLAPTAGAQAPETDPRITPAQGSLERGDFAQAIDSLKPLAAEGITQARFLLALALERAPPPLGRPADALGWYLKAAEEGMAAAQNNLGAMYIDGRGTAPDPVQSARWYRAAAEQGFAVSQYNLALLYANGKGVARDNTEMAKWMEKAALSGLASAQAQYGQFLLNGLGVKADPIEAARWFLFAANQRHAGAQYFLGLMLQKGVGLERNLAPRTPGSCARPKAATATPCWSCPGSTIWDWAWPPTRSRPGSGGTKPGSKRNEPRHPGHGH